METITIEAPVTIGDAIGLCCTEFLGVFFPGDAEIDKNGDDILSGFVTNPSDPQFAANVNSAGNTISTDAETGVKLCLDAIEHVKKHAPIGLTLGVLIKNRDALAEGDYSRAIQRAFELYVNAVIVKAWESAPLSKISLV